MAMLMMVAGIFASGQVIIQNKPIGSDVNKSNKVLFSQPNIDKTQYDVFQNPYSTVYMPKQSKQAEENQQMVNVTCQFVYDENVYRPGFDGFIYNEQERYNMRFDWGNKQLTASVPRGTYDIISCFYGLDIEITGLQLIIVKEQIEISSDTIIELRQDEIKNKVECVARNQDGERFMHALGYYDENGQYIVTQDGNVDVTDTEISIRGGGITYDIGTTCVGGLFSDPYASFADLYINDVSDRYSIVIAKTAYNDATQTFWVNKYSPENVQVGTMDNNAGDYRHTIETYKPSILGQKSDVKGIYVFPRVMHKDYIVTTGTNAFYPSENKDEINLEVYLNNPLEEGSSNVLAEFWFVDNIHMDISTVNEYVSHDDGSYEIVEKADTSYFQECNVAVPMVVNNGEIYYYNKGAQEHHPNIYYGGQPFVYDEFRNFNYIAHPAFSFTKSQKGMDWGTTVPVGSLCNETYYIDSQGVNYMRLSCDYYGQLGELRMSDLDALTMSLKYNGDEVCNDYFKLKSLAQDMVQQQLHPGTIDAAFVNENVEVDGLTGCNTMEVHFDQTQEDAVAPTMRMLQLRNTDDIVTNRFAQADEGILQFACGDFDYHFEGTFGWFDCNEAPNVEVSYAPYREDNWNELEVEEVPELFFLPGFGNFFRGSLASVTGEAYQGWFDLKIRLEDAAGNWQEQVISPAFCIDNLAYSSIATPRSENVREVARYNLAGQRVDSNATGVVIVKMSDGTARKVVL